MYDFKDIFSLFDIEGELISCKPHGEGLINNTYELLVKQNKSNAKYILQKINTEVFKNVDGLMNNIKLVTDFSRKKIAERGGNPDRETLTLICARDGKPYVEKGKEDFRIYKFIEDATTSNIVKDIKDFYNSGLAFGRFASLLKDFDASLLVESIPRFHDTRKRFNDLVIAVQKDAFFRKYLCRKEIDFAFQRENKAGIIVDKLKNGELPLRVTHNDTKLNNVMLDAKTGEPVAVIDLDTIMPGTVCYDFGDSIRSGCTKINVEEETDIEKVKFEIDYFETYVKGFMQGFGGGLTEKEAEVLPTGAIIMTYECGIRFLTDFLNGDIYFKKTRENQNLERARIHFKLVEQMENALPEMKKIINKYYKG